MIRVATALAGSMQSEPDGAAGLDENEIRSEISTSLLAPAICEVVARREVPHTDRETTDQKHREHVGKAPARRRRPVAHADCAVLTVRVRFLRQMSRLMKPTSPLLSGPDQQRRGSYHRLRTS